MIKKILLRAIIFENLLKLFKSQYYHELIIESNKEKKNILESKNGKELYGKIRELNNVIEDNQMRIRISEKCNNELTNTFKKVAKGFNVQNFIDDFQDMYCDITELILENTIECIEISSKTLKVALLEESENGNIDINDKKYLIHLK